MSFILVPKQGREVQVDGWHWRPTLELLLQENVLDRERCALLGAHGCGVGLVDGVLAGRIADGIERWLRAAEMKPGQRMLADLTVTSKERVPVVFSPDSRPEAVDETDLYSASHEWLVTFRDFCRLSNGFDVF